MTLHPRLTKQSIELVKRFEGLRRKAARLENGGWTIGYGHTLSAREGAEVTPEDAEALLIYDLNKVAAALETLTYTPLNPFQFGALVAFAFSIGIENFKTSSVLRYVNEGAHLQAAAAIELWRRADFRGDSLVVDALVRRRAAEKSLYLRLREGFRAVPSAVVPPLFDSAAVTLASQSVDLTNAADLRVSLTGEVAEAERIEAPGAATTAAALKVTTRLQKLFPEDTDATVTEVRPAQDVVDAVETAPIVVLEPAPEPLAEPAADPVPATAAEEPAYEAPAFEAPVVAEPPPPPPLFEPPRYDAAPTEFGDEGFGRRFSAPADEAGAPVSPNLHAPVVLLVGLFGAAMFIGALAAMVYGMATVVNLAIGLLGVICMVPAGLKLLLRAFGDRSSDRGD